MPPIEESATLLCQSSQQVAKAAGAKSSSHLLAWLIRLGGLGLFGVAFIDSSIVPVQLPGSADLLLLLLSAYRSHSLAFTGYLVVCTLAGSTAGGYVTWAAGAKGGEAALEKLGSGPLVRRAATWAKRNGMLSVSMAALMPPPVPLLPFVLAAGALGLTRGRFLLSYCAARAARYTFIGWLGYTYGRRFISTWEKDLKGWTTPVLIVVFGAMALATAFGLWKYFKARRKGK